jgi:ABC-type multidrug transport system ATPase subunit
VPPLASLHQVDVELGGNTVLENLEFELHAGEVIGITGPNGSGKTTLVRVMATLVRIASGTGEILDVDISGDDVYRIRRFIGLIGHNPTVLHHLSLEENLEHAARLAGLDLTRVPRALHTVGLEQVGERSAHASSFGMLRRLEVARLLLTKPRLLLLDEAVSGLDSEAKDLIHALIQRTIDGGGGVVVVSHDVNQLEDLCQGVLRLSAGQLV